MSHLFRELNGTHCTEESEKRRSESKKIGRLGGSPQRWGQKAKATKFSPFRYDGFEAKNLTYTLKNSSKLL